MVNKAKIIEIIDDYRNRILNAEEADDILPLITENLWTPVSEGLPADDEEVIVSCTDDSGDTKFSYTTVGWHYKNLWVVNNERNYFVRAWMPLPKPWEERRTDE